MTLTQARLFTAVALTGAVALGCGLLTGPDATGSLAIERFMVTPDHVDNGAKATLLWSVDGAETVTIDQGIGEVEPRGSVQVSPGRTTTYTLSASGGTSSATATVVVVVGKPGPSPSAGAPSPSPSPSATPQPSPTPSPSPSPSPSATPQPSPTPGSDNPCGAQTAAPDSCPLTVERPAAMGVNECVQLTRLTAIPGCPVNMGMNRTITFDIQAKSAAALSWRRAAGGGDAVSPASGSLLAQGLSSVNANAVVFDTGLTFEVVDAAGRVVLRFTMKHR